MDLKEKFARTQIRLDSVSPSFCLAKWLQVTLHLQNGFNHSCHHPDPHKIPLEGLNADPSSLHNTPFKKELRALMKKGVRPYECEYCWRVEDAPGSQVSDRILKSSDEWAEPLLDKIAQSDAHASIDPTYVEVSFGNECNFRCSYCSPSYSSALWNSFERHGAYVGRPTLAQTRAQGRAPLPAADNPYVKAFWQWFPSLVSNLKVFRITGGEPLINPNTFRVLDYLDEHPQPHLQLCVNSNLGVPQPLFEKFIVKVKTLTEAGKLKDFMLYTSIDTHGEQAEYLRVGLEYDVWLSRVRQYLSTVPWNVTFMVTFNALSVPRFSQLLDDLLQLNGDFLGKNSGKRTLLDISHLMYPEYFSVWILNPRWIEVIQQLADKMEHHSSQRVGPHGFQDYEIYKMKRVAAAYHEKAKRKRGGQSDASLRSGISPERR